MQANSLYIGAASVMLICVPYVYIHQVNKTIYRQSAEDWNSHDIIETAPVLIPKIATFTLFSVRWTLIEGV